MVKLNKNELELIIQVLKRAESISKDVNPESFIYSNDMYIGRNDSCRTALYSIDNKKFLEDFGEEEFEEIVWDELKLYEDHLYEKQANSAESEEISEKIIEVKKLIKKIKPYDE